MPTLPCTLSSSSRNAVRRSIARIGLAGALCTLAGAALPAWLETGYDSLKWCRYNRPAVYVGRSGLDTLPVVRNYATECEFSPGNVQQITMPALVAMHFINGAWVDEMLLLQDCRDFDNLRWPAGTLRADGTEAITVLRGWAPDYVIMEISYPKGVRVDANLTALAHAPRPSDLAPPWPWVRADKVAVVNYLTEDYAIHELALVGGKWVDHDLSALTGTLGAYSLHSYNRSGTIPAVVYEGADHRIWELAMVGGRWAATAIGAAAGQPVQGHFPVGYVRADGVNAVNYVGDDHHVHELALVAGPFKALVWRDTDLSAAANGTLATGGRIGAYVNEFNQSTVVYTAQGAGHHVHQMVLDQGVWKDTDISSLVNSDHDLQADASAFVDRKRHTHILACAGEDIQALGLDYLHDSFVNLP